MRRVAVAIALLLVAVPADRADAQGDELQTLSPPTSQVDAYLNYFGQDVDVDLETGVIVVGAYGRGPSRAGAAYVVEWDGDRWSFTMLQPDRPPASARAGSGVAIEGDLIAVGAPWDSRVATHGGAVYLFRLVNEAWVLEEAIAPPVLERDELFGFAVDIDHGRVAVGASSAAGRAGRVFVYEQVLGAWRYDLVEPEDGVAADWFGVDVHLDGDLLAVGATGVDGTAEQQGAVYLYRKDNRRWSLEERIDPIDPSDSLYFGVKLHGDGERIAVTAAGNFDDSSELGRVHLLTPTDDGWTQEIAFPGNAAYANLGTSVVLDGTTMFVGAMGAHNYERQMGQVLVLEERPGGWEMVDVLHGPLSAVTDVGFGWSAAGTKEGLVIGAPGFRANGEGSGEIYVRGIAAECFGLAGTMLGTPGDDVITATWDRDVIIAGSGDDRILDVAAGDIVCSGKGWDVIEGRNPEVADLSLRDWTVAEVSRYQVMRFWTRRSLEDGVVTCRFWTRSLILF